MIQDQCYFLIVVGTKGQKIFLCLIDPNPSDRNLKHLLCDGDSNSSGCPFSVCPCVQVWLCKGKAGYTHEWQFTCHLSPQKFKIFDLCQFVSSVIMSRSPAIAKHCLNIYTLHTHCSSLIHS